MEKRWKELVSEEVQKACQFCDSYEAAIELLSDSSTRGVVVPMTNIPFERDSQFHISAVLKMQNRGFFLSAKGELKNLFLLGESHTLHYTHDFIPFYVRDFNEQVKLVKVDGNQAQDIEYLIDEKGTDQAVSLNVQEFIPPAGQGIYVILTRTDDMDLRQKLIAEHDEETMLISNLQRKLLKSLEDQDVKGIYINKDANGHLHGVLALGNKAIRYVSYSQSTSHNYVENFLQQI